MRIQRTQRDRENTIQVHLRMSESYVWQADHYGTETLNNDEPRLDDEGKATRKQYESNLKRHVKSETEDER